MTLKSEIELGQKMAAPLEGLFESIFSYKSPTQLWLESDHVTRWCREYEMVRLQEEGHIIGGLS